MGLRLWFRAVVDVAAMERATGPEPRERFSHDLGEAWGRAEEKRTVRWPLSLRVGTV